MPRKKKVDGNQLIKAIQSGKPSTEVMAEFGISNSAQLKALYLDAMAEKGLVPGIVSARGGKNKDEKKSKEVKVTKRGSISIPKALIDEMGFQIGDAFQIRKTKAGISLRKL